jgi:hypothetical protein
MPHIQYVSKRFGVSAKSQIAQANTIIREYQAQGFDLTLRQLYYQFVSRDLIPNNQKAYNNLGSLISDALIGVIEGVCTRLDVPYFSCRSYTSQSEMWRAGQRLLQYGYAAQTPIILHFGDHDPSGKDMSRDIQDRLTLFLQDEIDFDFHRLALTMDQIDEFDPPPNPAKITDSRAKAYIAEFGTESWELDALEPKILVSLIEDAVASVCDADLYEAALERERTGRDKLQTVAESL